MNGDAECKLGKYCNRISSIFKIFDPRENLFHLRKCCSAPKKQLSETKQNASNTGNEAQLIYFEYEYRQWKSDVPKGKDTDRARGEVVGGL